MLYLDSAATTQIRREVLEAMWPYLTGDFGNPSSQHTVGESAARALKTARASLADWLGCRSSEILFTSGGTESDNLAVKGIALASRRGRHLVTTRTEHEAVLESVDYLVRLHGFEVTWLELDEFGRVDPETFEAALREDTAVASIMLANNEVGTVQPVAQLATIARAHGVPFHSDAVQAAGWLDLRLDVDALSVAGHKLGAPKGTGLLRLRGGIPVEPLLHGGGQERGRRSGTENVAGAVGLAAAAAATERDREQTARRAIEARTTLVEGVLRLVPEARLTGHPTERLPAHASFVFPGTSGEAVLLELERSGIVSSSGSACAAGRDDPSHVLIALGYSADLAQTAVRFSWGPDLDPEQLAAVPRAVQDAVNSVSSLAR